MPAKDILQGLAVIALICVFTIMLAFVVLVEHVTGVWVTPALIGFQSVSNMIVLFWLLRKRSKLPPVRRVRPDPASMLKLS